MPVKNTDKITNQAKINDWDCCDMEAKAQLTSDLDEPLSSVVHTTSAIRMFIQTF